MVAIIYPFLVLATAGFVAIVTVHLAALLGNTLPFERMLGILGPGVFVVCLPTVLVMNRLTQDFKQKDVWRAALRGCPRWMYRAFNAIFFYGWAGFIVLPLLYGGGMESRANQARCMSGGLLIFYMAAVSVLYSATRAEKFDESRRCLNGHKVSPLSKFCEECGAPVAATTHGMRQ
ncbi:MAG TPA: hypothetical protein VG892_08300 [Terriglobales bacterium]|nr:hypothetical protein [Terriglobales bacterium]